MLIPAEYSLTNGASVRLSGRLTDSPGPKQANELQVDEVVVWGKCDPDVRVLHSFSSFVFEIHLEGVK